MLSLSEVPAICYLKLKFDDWVVRPGPGLVSRKVTE